MNKKDITEYIPFPYLNEIVKQPLAFKNSLGSYDVHVNIKRIMIMNEETAHALIEKGLIMEVKNANKSEAVSSIPELAQGESILFAKEVRNEISIEGQSLT